MSRNREIRTYHRQHPEEDAVQLLSQQSGARCEHAQRKREPPPAHVERKALRKGDARRREDEPSQARAPHDQAQEHAQDPEHLPAVNHAAPHRRRRPLVATRHWQERHVPGDAAELLDGETALAEGPDGQEDGDDERAAGQLVDHEAVKVHGEDAAGEGLAESPEDVRGGEGGGGVRARRQVGGEDAARGGGDDGGDDGEEERCGGLLELGLVSVEAGAREGGKRGRESQIDGKGRREE